MLHAVNTILSRRRRYSISTMYPTVITGLCRHRPPLVNAHHRLLSPEDVVYTNEKKCFAKYTIRTKYYISI